MIGYGMGDRIFFTIFTIACVIILGVFILVVFKLVSTNVKNNNSPKLTVKAKVLDKRMSVWGEHSHTSYFITFEVEGGDRLELQINDKDYGLTIEGDNGKLTFQGTKFISFIRELQK